MSREDEPFEVGRGQTYVPCAAYNWQPSKPFVVEAVTGDKIQVWVPFGGPRGLGCHQWVARSSLHPTGLTRAGKERRTGWRLVSGPPRPGQELCGSCMRYACRDDLAIPAWGWGHSTCKPCGEEFRRGER